MLVIKFCYRIDVIDIGFGVVLVLSLLTVNSDSFDIYSILVIVLLRY